ncbi:MAG: peptidyl-prolyl cis-trans isomerase [Desulfuromonadales bacterium]|nr:peptidyl-prolyl cis-trans isomerase [Desulfuromonadales bacterium]
MHRIFLVFLIVPFLLQLVACETEAPVQPVAAPTALIQVNDQQVSKAEFLAAFEKTMQKDLALRGVERLELQRSFLIQLIDRVLIHGEARRLNVTVSDADVEAALAEYRLDYPEDGFEAMLRERGLTTELWRQELREGLIMEALLEQAVYSQIEVSAAEIAAYYKENRKDFNRPAQVRARQIVVADESEGRKLLGLLREGEEFATIAAEHSLSPDSEQGGDLGFFGRGEMPPEFDEVVFDLPVKRLSDLVQSEYGYHIFLVEEKRKAKQLGRNEAEEEIRRLLETSKREEIYLQWLQELRARAEISVDWTQLEAAEVKD